MSAYRPGEKGIAENTVFTRFCSEKGSLFGKNDEKMRIFQKKSPKCFAVKKKAVHLHSLSDSNGVAKYVASLAQLARARDL